MRRAAAIALAAAWAFAVPVSLAAQEAPREVNITSGSTPGWIPSEELEAEAVATFDRYFRLLSDGDYPSAHAMLSEGLQSMLPLEEFSEQERSNGRSWGSEKSRTVSKITWTKDAPGIPEPGIYVALDMTATFANVDRHCGYTILHRAPDADEFVIARTENTVLDNRAAASIAEANSPLQMELVWRIVARNCPNYAPPALPDTLSDGVEYSTVAEARSELEAREATETKQENGWTIIADRANLAVWSFAPPGDATYPSVIKRWVEPVGPDSSEASIGMLCEAEKPVCDSLFEEMALINGFIPLSIE
ncbi:DUF4019 domain-containing protein [Erythrobacter sp. JK5]|uniref:DUF4019 domain-containing protein n=1 Tax=Erythrobacter sp. JK5 TaxID=2829500 RepID=UPI001BA97046|nr:DUF4019 domain-containing protein [Erythrobacter sp. JK5]QUL38509.1 DUF4019 domain-containing protein [Erythrobacter sp. JK5]